VEGVKMDEVSSQERASALMREALAQLDPASEGEAITHLKQAIAALDTVANRHSADGPRAGAEG
jgi:hypothetical protein